MRLKSNLILRKMGDDYIIVEPELGMVDFSQVYRMNESAAWLWEELQGKKIIIEELVELVMSRYEIGLKDRKDIRQDIQELLAIWQNNHLLIQD